MSRPDISLSFDGSSFLQEQGRDSLWGVQRKGKNTRGEEQSVALRLLCRTQELSYALTAAAFFFLLDACPCFPSSDDPPFSRERVVLLLVSF